MRLLLKNVYSVLLQKANNFFVYFLSLMCYGLLDDKKLNSTF